MTNMYFGYILSDFCFPLFKINVIEGSVGKFLSDILVGIGRKCIRVVNPPNSEAKAKAMKINCRKCFRTKIEL